MVSPKKDDATPHGLSWGEDDQETKVSPVRSRAADDVKGLFASTQLGAGAAAAVTPAPAQGFFPPTPAGQKSPFAKTQQGSVAVPAPPPPSGDLSTISQLFANQHVPAPAIPAEELSEAELSWQEARQKRDLLNDRLASVAPVPAPIAMPPSAASKKATLVGAFGPGDAQPLANPRPHAAPPSAFAATIAAAKPARAPTPPAPQEPHVARAAPARPQPTHADPPASPHAGEHARGSQPSASPRTSHWGPPPPPRRGARSPARSFILIGGGLTLLLLLALAGGYAGLYELTPGARALLATAGLASPQAAVPSPRRAPTATRPLAPQASKPAVVASAPMAAHAAPAAKSPPPTAALAPKPEAAKPPAAAAAPAPTPAPVVAKVEKPAPAPKPEATVPPQLAEAAAPSAGDGAALAESARHKLASGDVAGAEAIVRGVLASDPSEHHAMEVLARVLLAQGKAQEALGYIQQIVKKRAKRAAYRVLEGDARSRLGDTAAARAAWQTAVDLDPKDTDAAQRLARGH